MWYIWDVRPVEPLLKYHGRYTMVITQANCEFERLLISQKHRMGSPVEDLIPLGDMPAFVVRQGQNLHLIQYDLVVSEAPPPTLQLKGVTRFGRFIVQLEALVFVQNGKVLSIPIVQGLGGRLYFGRHEEFRIDRRLHRASDIAVIGGQDHIRLQVLASYADGSLERFVVGN